MPSLGPVSEPQRRKRSDGMRRREQILAAAAELFSQRGFDATGIDEVGDAVGITGSAIYRHFASKDELFQQVLARALTSRIEGTAAIVEEASTAEEALDRLTDNLIESVLNERSLSATLWRDLRHLDAEGTGFYDRHHRLQVEEFVHGLRGVRPDLSDAERRARVDALYGLVLSAVETDSGLERASLQATLTELGRRALRC